EVDAFDRKNIGAAYRGQRSEPSVWLMGAGQVVRHHQIEPTQLRHGEILEGRVARSQNGEVSGPPPLELLGEPLIVGQAQAPAAMDAGPREPFDRSDTRLGE